MILSHDGSIRTTNIVIKNIDDERRKNFSELKGLYADIYVDGRKIVDSFLLLGSECSLLERLLDDIA